MADSLPAYPDPVGDQAAGRADSKASSEDFAALFQCTVCHVTGSAADEQSWPVLAGVRVHVASRVVLDEDAAIWGIEAWESRRVLCGPARVI